MTKETTLKQLLAYSSLATCFIATGTEAHAQIVHVDADPDLVMDADFDLQLPLDLDGDGMVDLTFGFDYEVYYIYGYQMDLVVEPGVEVLTGISPCCGMYWTGGQFPDSVSAGASIDASGNWDGGFMNIVCDNTCGPMPLDTFSLIGFRIQKSTDYIYGWMRLNTVSPELLIIDEWAYEETPGVPIAAGTIACDTPENFRLDSINSAGFVRLKWDAADNADSYEVEGRKLGTTFTQNVIKTGTKVQRSGLPSGQSYEIRVRSICGTQTSDWSDWLLVTIPSARPYGEISISPNPAMERVAVQLPEGLESSQVLIADLAGRIHQFIELPAEQSNQFQIDVSDMATGVYLMTFHGHQGSFNELLYVR